MQTKTRLLGLSVLASILLGAGLFWASPWVHAASEPADAQIKESFRLLAGLLAKVEEKYADEVDADGVMFHGAIPYMLRTLDPHSSFFPPDAFKQLREDQKGHYAGVGMHIGNRNGGTIVVAPIPRTPAFRAGLRPGDLIVEVDGKNVESLTVTEVAQRLRGQVNTNVLIGIELRGVDDLIEVQVTRARIPRPSLPTAFEIKPKVGFIRIESFTENTGEELDKALAALKVNELEGLVLDLRGNRGGLLSEGVRVSDPISEEGPVDRFPPRPLLEAAHLRGPARKWRQCVSDGRDGELQFCFCLGNRGRRAAGPRQGVNRRAQHIRQGLGADRVPPFAGLWAGLDHSAILHSDRSPHPTAIRRRLDARVLHQPLQ